MTQQQSRWRIFIDLPIQGALVLRALLYWAVCVLTQQLIVFLFILVTSASDASQSNAARLWWHMQLSVVAASAILPIILLDILKLSHRWVGPISRLRASLQALSRGEPVPPIRFRERDFWPELASDLNAVTVELNRHRANSSQENQVTQSAPATPADGANVSLEHKTDLATIPFPVCSDPQSETGGSSLAPIGSTWSAMPTAAR